MVNDADQTLIQIYVGCQGWRYADWRKSPSPDALVEADLAVYQPEIGKLWQGPFYSNSLLSDQELSTYAQTFSIVEVDSTFYGIPPQETVIRWREETPASFRFTLKLPRKLTHEYRLRQGRGTLAEFCQRAYDLGPKLAGVLIQLPPSFGLSELDCLSRFLTHLPTDICFFIEFRDPAWFSPEIQERLSQFPVSSVLSETPWIAQDLAYASINAQAEGPVYIRVMGPKEGELSQFTHLQVNQMQKLQHLVSKINAITAQNRQVYVLVDNHFQGFSPGTASLLKAMLQLPLQPYPAERGVVQLHLPLI
ncbi:DUF72 domain-containing protein [Leptolyngbya sp. FACHB-261]|uniref:DUF72 domain-containing protein n=1 Tax=Leptolyngbya sp. FACHB-261 TaxID=2692806 RepID=UPI0016837EA6|nr:DUF72 domain-containing protein [Leptolyngbya sp. FACHB-261]MBD2101569.1 DUF72 domain-containing protein [Leptolyngbya sp. FACHB-261]